MSTPLYPSASSHNILFVCHGNICRSPMAEFIMKYKVQSLGLQKHFPLIDSCAVSAEEIGNPLYPPARALLTRYGIPCSGHHARQITSADFARYDLIFAMDDRNLRLLRHRFGGFALGDLALQKVQLLLDRNVADPWYTGDFETTYHDLVEGCNRVVKEWVGM